MPVWTQFVCAAINGFLANDPDAMTQDQLIESACDIADKAAEAWALNMESALEHDEEIEAEMKSDQGGIAE